MDVTINNQCTNIELVSPECFIKDTTYNIHILQKVDSKSKMKLNFRIDMNGDTLGGVLLYHLQGRKNDEYDSRSDKNTSASTQLLVIWRIRIDRFYLHALLIKHESTHVWNEHKLERLFHVYDNQYNLYSRDNPSDWLLDDSTVLNVECESSHRGFEMEVIISEERSMLRPKKPFWVDSNR
jgi:hypothetical protein